jgi:phosphoribosylglycinamide formyltransferase-1
MKKTKIAVLISGSGTNLQAIINSVESGDISGNIEMVVSDRKNAYGLERAKKFGIDTFYFGKGNYDNKIERNNALLKKLKERDIDLIVLAGYLSILPKFIVKEYENRIINVHPSLIPKYCGAGFYGMKVHEAVILNKEEFSGVTVHFVDEGTDTGPIIFQEKIKIEETDTPDSLAERIHVVEHKLIVRAVKEFCEK